MQYISSKTSVFLCSRFSMHLVTQNKNRRRKSVRVFVEVTNLPRANASRVICSETNIEYCTVAKKAEVLTSGNRYILLVVWSRPVCPEHTCGENSQATSGESSQTTGEVPSKSGEIDKCFSLTHRFPHRTKKPVHVS